MGKVQKEERITIKMTGSVVADPKAKTHDKLFFSFTIQ